MDGEKSPSAQDVETMPVRLWALASVLARLCSHWELLGLLPLLAKLPSKTPVVKSRALLTQAGTGFPLPAHSTPRESLMRSER